MTVKKKFVDQIIVKNLIDLIDHFYFLALDIWEIDSQRRPGRQIKVVNIYDNQV